MSYINVKDFILNSTIEEPKKATYRDYTIMSRGEGGNRYIYIFDGDGKEVGYFWVDTHTDKACFIHGIRGKYWKTIISLLLENCSRVKHDLYDFECWSQVGLFMRKLIEELKSMSGR